MHENDLNVTPEQAIEKMAFLGLPFEADKMKVYSKEISGTGVVVVVYENLDVPAEVAHQFANLFNQIFDKPMEEMKFFTPPDIQAGINKKDETRGAVIFQTSYYVGEHAERFARAAVIHDIVSLMKDILKS